MSASFVGMHLLIHTLRHLRPVQIYRRPWTRLIRPRPRLAPPPVLRHWRGDWSGAAARKPSILNLRRIRLLEVEHELVVADDWQAPDHSDLFRYNLHYFDDLNALGARDRREWHSALIERWIAENPPGKGVGWAPYPTSLRMVNWIKAALSGFELPAEAVHSLAVQGRWLERRLEWHLLGNHLFANAKALVFAGCYFEGSEADGWLGTGLRILARELPEQVLPDGGQFELSPMYHALAFEDLLDLVNLAAAFPGRIDTAVVDSWRQTAIRMWRWLRVMTHPDGELAFFNDTAIGVAPSNGELEAYALRLGIEAPEGEPFDRFGTSGQGDGGASLDTLRTGGQGGGEATFGGLRTGGDGAGSVEDADPGAGLIHLPGSGYLRLSHGPATLFLDCARIGPDYLPGHAHADQLSFELSIGARRVLVNTGIDRYGTDAERVRQRGTAAHNCVVVDGQDSAEVWSGFRVARRGYPLDLVATKSEASLEVACSHTGYRRLPGRVLHRRRWRLEAGQLLIEDRLSGRFGQAEAWFHLHPDIVVKLDDPRKARISLPDGRLIGLSIEGGSARLQPSQWRPGFGRSLDTQVVVVALNDTGLTTIWRW